MPNPLTVEWGDLPRVARTVIGVVTITAAGVFGWVSKANVSDVAAATHALHARIDSTNARAFNVEQTTREILHELRILKLIGCAEASRAADTYCLPSRR